MQEKKKREYEKPVLRAIELAADEVLAVGCKATSGLSQISGPQCGVDACVSTVGS
jgi:hypothetical protein